MNLQDVSDKREQFPIGRQTIKCVKASYIPPEGENDASLDLVFCLANQPDNPVTIQQRMFSILTTGRWQVKKFFLAAGKPEYANAKDVDTDWFVGCVVDAHIGSEQVVDKDTKDVNTYSRLKKFFVG
jgi:hypothetical protein